MKVNSYENLCCLVSAGFGKMSAEAVILLGEMLIVLHSE